MAVTIEKLRRLVKHIGPPVLKGCVDIVPPVRVRCIKAASYPDSETPRIEVGEILHVEQFDMNGEKPNHLKFYERAYWWPAENFQIIK